MWARILMVRRQHIHFSFTIYVVHVSSIFDIKSVSQIRCFSKCASNHFVNTKIIFSGFSNCCFQEQRNIIRLILPKNKAKNNSNLANVHWNVHTWLATTFGWIVISFVGFVNLDFQILAVSVGQIEFRLLMIQLQFF